MSESQPAQPQRLPEVQPVTISFELIFKQALKEAISWLPGRFDDYEIGWIIFDLESRGKGYTAEAAQMVISWMFNGMRINRIVAYVHPNNIASQRIAEKCGFKHEATLHGIWYQHGEHQDLELYRILREELRPEGLP